MPLSFPCFKTTQTLTSHGKFPLGYQRFYSLWYPSGRKEQRRTPCYLMAASRAHHCILPSISRDAAPGGAKWRTVYDTDDGMTTQKAKGELYFSSHPFKVPLATIWPLLIQCLLAKRYKSLASNGVISADLWKWPNTDVEWNSWRMGLHQHYPGYRPANRVACTVLNNCTGDNNKVYWSLWTFTKVLKPTKWLTHVMECGSFP